MQQLQSKLKYQFKNIDHLILALQHKSTGRKNNEKMEFLGDAVLNFVAAELVFTQFNSIEEGHMSRVRSALVREETLCTIANRLGVLPLIRWTASAKTPKAPASMVADAMEAIYAAILLDGGYEAAKKVIRAHLIEVLERREAPLTKDSKTELQEIVQAKGIPLPEYKIIRNVADPVREIEVSCEIPLLKIRSTGLGPTRKQAEAHAAQRALKAIAY